MYIHSERVNETGVIIAAAGTALGDYALQLAGFLVTVLVAYWNSRAKQATQKQAEEDRQDIRHERDRADFYLRKCVRQETELVRLRAGQAAVSPPFEPGEAATDA